MQIDYTVASNVPTSPYGNRRGGGRKLTYPMEIEDHLMEWVLCQREQGLSVSLKNLQDKAKVMITPYNSDFKASDGWVQSFKHRHSLSLRARTTMAQKLPANLEDKITSFHSFVKEMRSKNSYKIIGNMDETPVFFDMVPNSTLDVKGKKTIKIRTSGSEKRHTTVCVTVTSDGDMLPPMIIFKGKRALKLRHPLGVQVEVQERGWVDQLIMKEWIQKIWFPYTKKQSALLVLDSFRVHLTEETKKLLKSYNTDIVFIPGGCTSKIQPVDVTINKPFKSLLRESWCDYMQDKVKEESSDRIQAPSKQIVLDWVVSGWRKLKNEKEMIKHSFLACGISNNLDGSDDLFFRNDTHLYKVSEHLQCLFDDTSLDEEPFEGFDNSTRCEDVRCDDLPSDDEDDLPLSVLCTKL